MKKAFYCLFLLTLLTAKGGYCLDKLDHIHIISYEGDVAIKRDDLDDWIEADLNMPLTENDQIWVASKSKLEIRTKNGSFVRLNEYTSLDILYLSNSGYQFYSEGGDVYINYKTGLSNFLQFDTPTITIMAYDNAKFRVEIFDDGETDVSVFEGEITIKNKKIKLTLRDNEKASFDEESILEKGKIYSLDSWEKWNISRDKTFSIETQSVKYLPEELHSYAYDFDLNGRWIIVKDYGYVWQPAVIIKDWAPYRLGYWVWMKGDYVWISLEPWGWVPYHYGRWVYTSRYGWVWVPPARGLVYWAPAYVGWVYTDNYIFWIPLAPGEIYYGYGNFGPHSVNITNINIKITNIVFKNINAPGGYTVIQRKNFLTAKQIFEKVNENPFTSRKVQVGRPEFDPKEVKKIIVGKRFTIRDDKKLPGLLLERNIERVKERRPLIVKESPEITKGEKILHETGTKIKDRDVQSGETKKEKIKPVKKWETQELKINAQKKMFKKREKFKDETGREDEKGRKAFEKDKGLDKKIEHEFTKEKDK